MINRDLAQYILDRLQNSAAVALMGPRQVGKTTLAFKISETLSSVYLDLENSTDLRKVENIEAYYQANSDKLIILDEVQRLPEIFAPIRGLIDQQRRAGNKTGLFLFLGSASIELLRQSSESLAGRIAYIELFPIHVTEFLNGPQNTELLFRLWLRGGFPESLLAKDDKNSLRWRKDFIRTYLERDIPMLGPRVPTQTLERLWMMLAHGQGTAINASKLAGALEVSNTSIARYIDLLVDLLLIRKLLPYTKNIKKRLVKSPRIYVRDSGITHALLNIKDFNDLLGNPVVGKSWEGFVVENIMAVLPESAEAFYYRTAGGAEIDLVIDHRDLSGEIWAIEIKRSASAHLSRGFYEACEDIKPKRKFIVHAEPDTFALKDDVQAISLYAFLQLLREG